MARTRTEEMAGFWLVRLAAPDFDEADRAEFENWCQAHPDNSRVFDELARVDADLSALGALGELDPGILSDELRAARQDEQQLGARSHGPSLTVLRYAVAATFAIALVGLGVWISKSGINPAPEATTYATLVGEQDELLLADGSIVSLNTASSLSVAYTDAMRTVYLRSGEAYFQVAKDAQRPFVVHVGRETVEAVGTAFSVYYRDKMTRVSVTEGTVAFGARPGQGLVDINRLDGEGNAVAQRVDRGQYLILDESRDRAEVYEEANTESVASWRFGKLYFDGATLTDIVNEVGYYLPQRVVVADQSIANYRGSGVFRVDSADSILKALEAAWPIRIEYEDEDLVLLYAER